MQNRITIWNTLWNTPFLICTYTFPHICHHVADKNTLVGCHLFCQMQILKYRAWKKTASRKIGHAFKKRYNTFLLSKSMSWENNSHFCYSDHTKTKLQHYSCFVCCILYIHQFCDFLSRVLFLFQNQKKKFIFRTFLGCLRKTIYHRLKTILLK